MAYLVSIASESYTVYYNSNYLLNVGLDLTFSSFKKYIY